MQPRQHDPSATAYSLDLRGFSRYDSAMQNDSFRRAAEGLERALQRLAMEYPLKYQVLIRYMNGDRIAKIASELSITPAAASKRLLTGRKLCTKYLNLEESRTFNAKLDQRFPKKAM